jgi:hypothetical protein
MRELMNPEQGDYCYEYVWLLYVFSYYSKSLSTSQETIQNLPLRYASFFIDRNMWFSIRKAKCFYWPKFDQAIVGNFCLSVGGIWWWTRRSTIRHTLKSRPSTTLPLINQSS